MSFICNLISIKNQTHILPCVPPLFFLRLTILTAATIPIIATPTAAAGAAVAATFPGPDPSPDPDLTTSRCHEKYEIPTFIHIDGYYYILILYKSNKFINMVIYYLQDIQIFSTHGSS